MQFYLMLSMIQFLLALNPANLRNIFEIQNVKSLNESKDMGKQTINYENDQILHFVETISNLNISDVNSLRQSNGNIANIPEKKISITKF